MLKCQQLYLMNKIKDIINFKFTDVLKTFVDKLIHENDMIMTQYRYDID